MSDIFFADDAQESTHSAEIDSLTATQRHNVRTQLEADMAAFLSQGGHIQSIADNVRADPPRKPTMNYGSAPI